MLRGKVWQINLDPTIGAEIKKTRPAVIVNDYISSPFSCARKICAAAGKADARTSTSYCKSIGSRIVDSLSFVIDKIERTG